MIKPIWIFGLLILGLSSFAQNIKTDSLYQLAGVEITSSKIDLLTTGQKVLTIDSISLLTHQAENIGQLLSRNSEVQIRSYGGLNTISTRGTSSHHTNILWNGFAINPSNSGIVELSLIPTGHFDEVKLLYGGGSSLYGSGAIGGSVKLGSKPAFQKGNSGGISFSTGSFNNFSTNGRLKISAKNWYSNTSVILKSAKNDFPYKKLDGENGNMLNNKTEQFGFIQDINRKINNAILGGSFWYQSNKQELPASLTEKPSDAWLEDHSFRTVFTYNQALKASSLSIKGAFFHDMLNFVDPDENEINATDSKIETNKTSVEAIYSKSMLENSILKTGVIFINDQGISNNWEGEVLRRQLGMFVYWVQYFELIKWELDIKLRQDFTEGYHVPFTPAVGFEGAIYKNIFGKFSISRNFRVPTFNDLFWIGSGNKDLKPESSWNGEVGVIYKLDNKKQIKSQIELTGFSSKVDDWIIWDSKGILYIPNNIQKVWSRGIEIQGSIDFDIRNANIKLRSGYTYTNSTNEKSLSEYDNAYKKQLIYVPRNRLYGSIAIECKAYYLAYNHSYVGIQFVSSDNLESIPSYNVGDISLRKNVNIRKQNLALQGEVLNLWDADYQTYRYYSMPGRSFKISLILSIK